MAFVRIQERDRKAGREKRVWGLRFRGKGRGEAETVVGGDARRQALAGTDLEAEHALLRAPVEGGWLVMARLSGVKGARVAI